MGGAGATGGYLGIMGGTLGGIGDIIQATNYEPPHLPEARGMEQRLRQLAQAQLLGGGQQLLSATALYNQMAPILMGQLPGMHYVPPTGGGAGGGGGGGAGGGSPMADYQTALRNFQQNQARAQQLTALKAQIKGTKQHGPERRALIEQRKALKQEIKSQPNFAAVQRQMYLAGTQPAQSAMFDIRQGPPSGGPPATQGASLGSINDLIGLGQGGGGGPDLGAIYRGAGY
jgi:hypothetical protein